MFLGAVWAVCDVNLSETGSLTTVRIFTKRRMSSLPVRGHWTGWPGSPLEGTPKKNHSACTEIQRFFTKFGTASVRPEIHAVSVLWYIGSTCAPDKASPNMGQHQRKPPWHQDEGHRVPIEVPSTSWEGMDEVNLEFLVQNIDAEKLPRFSSRTFRHCFRMVLRVRYTPKLAGDAVAERGLGSCSATSWSCCSTDPTVAEVERANKFAEGSGESCCAGGAKPGQGRAGHPH